MEIRKATQRIGWRFSEAAKREDKSFRINKQDLEALESIGEYVEQTQKEQFLNHELFAKLFIYLYMKILQNDKATVFDTKSRKKIYNLLAKDLPTITQEFTDSLNESEQYELIESVQGKIKHPAALSQKERASNSEKLKESLTNPVNKSRLLGEVWQFDFVKECLESEVNQAINLFR